MTILDKKTIVDSLKCINFFYSKTAKKLTVDHDLKDIKTNTGIIRQKAVNDFINYNNVNTNVKQSELIGFLINLANNNDIKINKGDYSGQYNYINIDEKVFNSYIDLMQFINKNDFNFKWKYDGLIFSLGQLLYSTTTYLLTINTLKLLHKNNSSFLSLVTNLVYNKPAKFWIRAYYKDLLVHDRVELFNNKKVNTIVCMKEYCSTSILDSAKESIDHFIANNGGLYNKENTHIYNVR